MASAFNQADKHLSRPKAYSICDTCNSKSYCGNAAPGMIACKDFNKFPKPAYDEPRVPSRRG